jgi:hypothetical protein
MHIVKNNKVFWLVIPFVFIAGVWFVPEGRLIIVGALYEVNPDWFIEDKNITKGSWGEFNIGDSKSEVASKLLSTERGDVYIDKRYYRENKFGLLTPLNAIDANTVLYSRVEWKVYLSKKASDYVVFKFNKENLVSIQRYLKTLESL